MNQLRTEARALAIKVRPPRLRAFYQTLLELSMA